MNALAIEVSTCPCGRAHLLPRDAPRACSRPGCSRLTHAILCATCREAEPLVSDAPARGFYEGETARFVWRGVEREGTIEKVGRTRVVVACEVNEKTKLLTVDFADLLPVSSASPETERAGE